VSTSALTVKEFEGSSKRDASKRVDLGMLAGIAVALTALITGIAVTGVRPSFFFQPSGILIVFGGTLGVTFVTTPRNALRNAIRRLFDLLWEHPVDRTKLIEEIMACVRAARTRGLLGIEPLIQKSSHPFLRDSLRLALDVQRGELQTAIETKLRLRERRGETDAKTFEVAGGFAPTIGVLGTVVGLVDVLRRFSDIQSVAGGVGTAFASTLYGLGLANLLLLPLAHRIRATVAEQFETEELILEGTLCILDGVHPSLVPERLNAFLREERP
jgi:chemotaxis protein MotA